MKKAILRFTSPADERPPSTFLLKITLFVNQIFKPKLMKKSTLLLAALVFCAIAMYAQVKMPGGNVISQPPGIENPDESPHKKPSDGKTGQNTRDDDCTVWGEYWGDLIYVSPTNIECTVIEGASINTQYQISIQNISSAAVFYHIMFWSGFIILDPGNPPCMDTFYPGEWRDFYFTLNVDDLNVGQYWDEVVIFADDEDLLYFDDAFIEFSLEIFSDSPPESLTATVSGNDVNLAWENNAKNKSDLFNVYRNGSLIAENVSGLTYSDAGLLPDAYSYFVKRVIPGFGITDYSNQAVALVNVTGVYLDTIDSYVEIEPGKNYMDASVFITDNGHLKILPGAELLFTGKYGISVSGTGKIEAVGSETDSIIFSCIDTLAFFNTQRYVGGWKGIRFGEFNEYPMTANADSSKLKFCHIEFAKGLNDQEEAVQKLTSNNDYGGGFFIGDFSKVSIQQCAIQNNFARQNGGGICCMATNGNECSPLLAFNALTENYAGNMGGGVYFGTTSGGNCAPNLQNNLIDRNIANYKLCVETTKNTNMAHGGGIAAEANTGTMQPVLFGNQVSNNKCLGGMASGGGIYASFDDVLFSTFTIANNTLLNNIADQMADEIKIKATDGSEIYLDFISNIVWDSKPFQFVVNQEGGATIGGRIGHCNIRHGENAISGLSNSNLDYIGGTYDITCINENPGLTLTANGIYEITSSSPCINKGYPGTTEFDMPLLDLSGNSRIMNGIVDIGATESQNALPDMNLNITIMLEGSFAGPAMATGLNDLGLLPLAQPYDTLPWCYYGSEAVAEIADADIVDWVLVELRNSADGPGDAASNPPVCRAAAFVDKTGKIINTTDGGFLHTRTIDTNNLYVVIYHRNHLPVISAVPIENSEGVYSYDFTQSPGKYYLDSLSCVEVGQGIWAMISGNALQDNQINNQDKNESWVNMLGNSGYCPADFNMDGLVDNTDEQGYWESNAGKGSSIYKEAANPIFECGNPFTDARDGHTYNTVLIDAQCWMTENLAYLPEVSPSSAGSETEPYYYVYDYQGIDTTAAKATTNYQTYGVLYNWPASQTACPAGWHIPYDMEWQTLEGIADSEIPMGDPIWGTWGWRGFDVGVNLKSSYGFNGSGNGIDVFGFNGMPGGARADGGYYAKGWIGFWWTQNTNDWSRCLDGGLDGMYRGGYDKQSGRSVRCLNTTYNQAPETPSSPNPSDGAINQFHIINLSWSCSDPEGDPITFDIYFGTEPNPQLMASQQSLTHYNAGSLEINKAYYWKIIAYDSHNHSSESPVWSFTTGDVSWQCNDPIMDQRDGQIYNTVQIGDQCWMAENLAYLPDVSPSSAGSETEPHYYVYDYQGTDTSDAKSTVNYQNLGVLYNWPATINACPDGWYLPTDNEWKILEGTVDSQYPVGDPIWNNGGWRGFDAGLNLKSLSGWDNNGQGVDLFGFNGLPSGDLRAYDGFYSLRWLVIYWCSEPYSYSRCIGVGFDNVCSGGTPPDFGRTIRCINTTSNQAPETPSSPNPSDGAINQFNVINLSWSCSDPENNPLTFDVCFGIEPNPPLIVSQHSVANYDLDELENNTIYYWKIIAHDNHNNSAESPVWSFTTNDAAWQCNDPIIDQRDGQIYTTVQIGEQCWMAENLNMGNQIDGNSEQSDNGSIEKYCYNNNSDDCDEYGGLYQWDEMMQYETTPRTPGICPPTGGWHLPSDSEWVTLSNFLGGKNIAGGKMKETGTTHWLSPNVDATNSSGFTALSGGSRNTFGDLLFQFHYGFWWTSSELDASNALSQSLYMSLSNMATTGFDRAYGFSVRCIRDGEIQVVQATVITTEVNEITLNTAESGGYITDHGGAPVINRGVVWSKFQNPTIDNNEGISSDGTGIGRYYSSLSGLTVETPYFVRAYATNSAGTAYGTEVSFLTSPGIIFTCGDVLIDPRNAQVYNVVKIGSQCWMAENLNIGLMINGINDQMDNGIIEKYCQNDLAENCEIYGGLYQWDEMMQYTTTAGAQGICPPTGGWHLPTYAEWCSLQQEVDPIVTCGSGGYLGVDGGGKLKEAGSSLWASPNFGATNSSGFTALPAGYRNENGSFGNLGGSAAWRSSSRVGTSNAWYWSLPRDFAQIFSSNFWSEDMGFSVRCLSYGGAQVNLPAVTTTAVTGITQTTAVSGGNVIDDGGELVTTRGVVWSTNENPSYSNNAGMTTDGEGTGIFVSNLSGLSPGTNYFVRAYAYNSTGIAYGNEVSFTIDTWQCGSPFADARDGQIYTTVQIGDQCWMAENLNIAQDSSGNPITKYCYNNDPTYCDHYGGLYNWNTIMNGEASSGTNPSGVQGICPNDWHMPSDAEWTELVDYVVSQGYPNTSSDPNGAGNALKSCRQVNSPLGGDCNTSEHPRWKEDGTHHGFDNFGFASLPGGSYGGGFYGSLGSIGCWWSSAQYSSPIAWNRYMDYNSGNVLRYSSYKTSGFSVRCLRD